MSDFTTNVTPLKNQDAFKRVAYPLGMMLTPAEFLQEQYYFRARDSLHHRMLHGYGTVCGLKVTIEDNDKITVSSGLAIDAEGRLIRVAYAQCASLQTWIAKNRGRISVESPPIPPERLYIVLCYHECDADKVLIRTSPCQSEEQSAAYSRVQEHFKLKLTTEPPQNEEGAAFKAFGDLFAVLRISSDADRLSEIDLLSAMDEFGDLVSQLDLNIDPPPIESPPAGWMQALHPADAEVIFRHAFMVWVTQVKPKLKPLKNCTELSEKETCVLLAELGLNIDPTDWQIMPEAEVIVNETDRPFCISTRMLQEYLFNRFQSEALGDVTQHKELCGLEVGDDHPQYLNENRGDNRYSPIIHSHSLDSLSDVAARHPVEGQVLTWQSIAGQLRWIPLDISTGVTAHADLTDLDADDHLQYLLCNGDRPLEKDLSAGGNKITGLAAATDIGEAIRYEQGIKTGQTAGGDLSDSYPNPKVKGLQGWAVSDMRPDDGQVLTWIKEQKTWEPQSINRDFVAAPAGPYEIVAAGSFDWDNQNNVFKPSIEGVVYNKITIETRTETGQFVINFNDYKEPADGHVYIVKATFWKSKYRATLEVISFQRNGIRVQMLDTNDQFPQTGVMIEISAFGKI